MPLPFQWYGVSYAKQIVSRARLRSNFTLRWFFYRCASRLRNVMACESVFPKTNVYTFPHASNLFLGLYRLQSGDCLHELHSTLGASSSHATVWISHERDQRSPPFLWASITGVIMARTGSPLANVSAEKMVQEKTVVSMSAKAPEGGLAMRISDVVQTCNYVPRKQTVP